MWSGRVKIIECAIDIDNTVPSRTRHAPSTLYYAHPFALFTHHTLHHTPPARPSKPINLRSPEVPLHSTLPHPSTRHKSLAQCNVPASQLAYLLLGRSYDSTSPWKPKNINNQQKSVSLLLRLFALDEQHPPFH